MIIFIVLFSACAEDDSVADVQNFRPLNLSVQVKDEFDVTIFWKEVNNSVSYTLQISEFADFNHIIKDTLITSACCDIKLFPGHFYVRVKSNNSKENLSSRWQKSEFEVIQKNVITDLIAESESVRILWERDLELGSIVLSSENGAIKAKELSSEDLKNKFVDITDLDPLTSYTVSFFAGDNNIGTGNFKTLPKHDKNQVVINPSSDIDSLLSNIKDKSVIVFEPGTYPIGGKNIEINGVSVTLQSSGSVSDETAEIYPKSILLKGKIGSVIFKNLTLSGFAFGGNSYDDLNSYFIDLDTDFKSIDTLIVEGCTIHHLENCIIRGNRGEKGEQSAKYIAFRNCIIYNVNRDGKNSYENFKLDKLEIEEFILENCTFYDIGHGFFSNRDVSTLKNFVIKNCTFDNFGSTDFIPNKYLINVPDGTGVFTIENSIFSNTKCYDSDSGNHSKGFIFGCGSSHCYNNVFYRFPITPSEVAEWNEIESVFDNYNPKYADQAIGDFTIGCEALKNGGRNGEGIGDLRWIK